MEACCLMPREQNKGEQSNYETPKFYHIIKLFSEIK